ncbi:hypothetical protein BCR43DRAFT_478609 [Syncephalastrum racemosum]|uniref:Pectin lyase fold/virulence factor n=1 Tax=Syncephalastrum racemosum TaxID=13706 RepID=A0A1X2H528_SYNRA|nr:hypothetical protein BCR43DRAFT_478609 [Syncephalastrum racemosum]
MAAYGKAAVDYTATLQDAIDDASTKGKPVVNVVPGTYKISAERPIILRPGVSLHGSDGLPVIFTSPDTNKTAAIQVPASNAGWSIKSIVFDNVNIEIEPHTNGDESSVLGNLFLNNGRGGVVANYGENLFIDGNIFLRDFAHASQERFPKYNTTNAGVVFQTQKSSVVSNNIFGMDLRRIADLAPHVPSQLVPVLRQLDFIHGCLEMPLDDQQGFLASGVQLYSTNDITIKENIMNATLKDTVQYSQDHAISIVGSNQTYIYQNFVAGWELADFGGAARFTSAVDGFVISNYLANDAIMMYAATHADFMQVSNMVVYNNFFYRFLDKNVQPVEEELDGWLYEGVTFFDFYTARLNYTIMPPIWNSSVPVSPWGWHIVVSSNKFGAKKGLDPNVISLGNLDPREAMIDRSNCYVNDPLIPDSDEAHVVPLLWRQSFEPGVYTRFGSKIPKKFDYYTREDLTGNIPAHLRNLPIPNFWKAFKLANETEPMQDPSTPCYPSYSA